MALGTPAGPAPLRLQLARAAPPRALGERRPAWAEARAPGAAVGTPDTEVPKAGPAALPPGWWGSSAKAGRGLAISRRRMLVMVVSLGAGFLIGLSPTLARNPSAAPSATLSVLLITIPIVAVALVSAHVSMRRRTSKTAESFLRIDPGGADPAAVAAVIDSAVRGLVPLLAVAAPMPAAEARWETPGSTFQLTLWRGVAGQLPLLEVRSVHGPAEVAAVKGAVVRALYPAA
jgi:hypothetical protein